MWIRTCQECGNKQAASKPRADDLKESWRNLKCKRCKSEALDYGKEIETIVTFRDEYI